MALAKKILNVMKACRKLTYDSKSDEVGYKFVSAAKVNAAVNAALVENGIICLPTASITYNREVETSGGKEILASVEVKITLVDSDSDETFEIKAAGQGIDAGDKAVAKAQTMAIKYAWKMTLLIADTADDPDDNKNTQAYSGQEVKAFNEVKKRYDERGEKRHPSFLAKMAQDALNQRHSDDEIPF